MERSALIEVLANAIARVNRPHPVRVAIDGVDGVGKTTLADELVDSVQRHGLPVIRASVDGFHNPRSVRYRLGRRSPVGYFHDSFNYASLTAFLLGPLGPGGSLLYRRAVFSYRTDSELPTPSENGGSTFSPALRRCLSARPRIALALGPKHFSRCTLRSHDPARRPARRQFAGRCRD